MLRIQVFQVVFCIVCPHYFQILFLQTDILAKNFLVTQNQYLWSSCGHVWTCAEWFELPSMHAPS